MSARSLSGGNKSSIIDMILIGAGIIIIICLLAYIYNQFIHKRYNKNENEYMEEEAFSIQPCNKDKLVCDACVNGRNAETGQCNPT